MRKVLFVAGEASGDLHAAGVAGALARIRPDLELAAVGGPRLAEQGVELIHRDHQLGVMGFLEVLKHVPRHFRLLRRIGKMLARGEVAPVLALFPGSRQQEIDRHIGAFVETAQELQSRIPRLRVVVSVAPTVALDTGRCPFTLAHSASLTVLRAADAALCKSGTTTLEASIADCPLVVAYRTGRISFALAKRLVKVTNIGLVNVVAGRQVAREFIQDEIVPSRMAAELQQLLEPASSRRREVLDGLAEVRSRLGTPGAAGRVADMASDLAGNNA